MPECWPSFQLKSFVWRMPSHFGAIPSRFTRHMPRNANHDFTKSEIWVIYSSPFSKSMVCYCKWVLAKPLHYLSFNSALSAISSRRFLPSSRFRPVEALSAKSILLNQCSGPKEYDMGMPSEESFRHLHRNTTLISAKNKCSLSNLRQRQIVFYPSVH